MQTIEELLYKDDFDVMFRRQGWLTFRYAPVYNDPEVIKLRWIVSTSGRRYSPDAFYVEFGGNTFRKLLRFIFDRPQCTRQELRGICSNDQILDEHLVFLKEQEIVVEEATLVKKAPSYEHLKNIGHTLEWYVAEWFRKELRSPARHRVYVEDIAEGSDLDVVAFVDGLRIWVECKSGKEITEKQLELFLQRAQEFSPTMAILLIDTDSSIEPRIEILNKHRSVGDPLTSQNQQNTLYWGMHHVYVVNAKKSIAHSLAAALRLYRSKVSTLSFWA